MRRSQWHQSSPRDQACSVLMALEGQLSNVEDGVLSVDHALSAIQSAIEQLRELHAYLPDNWGGEK